MYVCRIKKNVEMQIFHVKSRGVRRRVVPEAVDTVGGGAGGGRRMRGRAEVGTRGGVRVSTGGQDEWGRRVWPEGGAHRRPEVWPEDRVGG